MNTPDEQDTKPFTVYRDYNGYGYQPGHIEMDCQYSHVNWTSKMRISKKNLERLEKGLDIIPSEAMEGEAFTLFLYGRMVDIESKDAGVLEFSHIPNGTWSKNGGVNVNLKKQGVRKGSPDYYIAIRNTHGEESLIFIELKRIDGGDGGSDEQKRMIKILNSIPNVAAHFAFGAEQAIEILERYIDI